MCKPNPFDNQFIATSSDLSENGKNQVSLQQAAFYAEQYNSTYITALDLALQGLISPSTLGIDTKKLDNAEAQREKEKTTLLHSTEPHCRPVRRHPATGGRDFQGVCHPPMAAYWRTPTWM